MLLLQAENLEVQHNSASWEYFTFGVKLTLNSCIFPQPTVPVKNEMCIMFYIEEEIYVKDVNKIFSPF